MSIERVTTFSTLVGFSVDLALVKPKLALVAPLFPSSTVKSCSFGLATISSSFRSGLLSLQVSNTQIRLSSLRDPPHLPAATPNLATPFISLLRTCLTRSWLFTAKFLSPLGSSRSKLISIELVDTVLIYEDPISNSDYTTAVTLNVPFLTVTSKAQLQDALQGELLKALSLRRLSVIQSTAPKLWLPPTTTNGDGPRGREAPVNPRRQPRAEIVVIDNVCGDGTVTYRPAATETPIYVDLDLPSLGLVLEKYQYHDLLAALYRLTGVSPPPPAFVPQPGQPAEQSPRAVIPHHHFQLLPNIPGPQANDGRIAAAAGDVDQREAGLEGRRAREDGVQAEGHELDGVQLADPREPAPHLPKSALARSVATFNVNVASASVALLKDLPNGDTQTVLSLKAQGIHSSTTSAPDINNFRLDIQDVTGSDRPSSTAPLRQVVQGRRVPAPTTPPTPGPVPFGPPLAPLIHFRVTDEMIAGEVQQQVCSNMVDIEFTHRRELVEELFTFFSFPASPMSAVVENDAPPLPVPPFREILLGFLAGERPPTLYDLQCSKSLLIVPESAAVLNPMVVVFDLPSVTVRSGPFISHSMSRQDWEQLSNEDLIERCYQTFDVDMEEMTAGVTNVELNGPGAERNWSLAPFQNSTQILRPVSFLSSFKTARLAHTELLPHRLATLSRLVEFEGTYSQYRSLVRVLSQAVPCLTPDNPNPKAAFPLPHPSDTDTNSIDFEAIIDFSSLRFTLLGQRRERIARLALDDVCPKFSNWSKSTSYHLVAVQYLLEDLTTGSVFPVVLRPRERRGNVPSLDIQVALWKEAGDVDYRFQKFFTQMADLALNGHEDFFARLDEALKDPWNGDAAGVADPLLHFDCLEFTPFGARVTSRTNARFTYQTLQQAGLTNEIIRLFLTAVGDLHGAPFRARRLSAFHHTTTFSALCATFYNHYAEQTVARGMAGIASLGLVQNTFGTVGNALLLVSADPSHHQARARQPVLGTMRERLSATADLAVSNFRTGPAQAIKEAITGLAERNPRLLGQAAGNVLRSITTRPVVGVLDMTNQAIHLGFGLLPPIRFPFRRYGCFLSAEGTPADLAISRHLLRAAGQLLEEEVVSHRPVPHGLGEDARFILITSLRILFMKVRTSSRLIRREVERIEVLRTVSRAKLVRVGFDRANSHIRFVLEDQSPLDLEVTHATGIWLTEELNAGGI
ncbi:hypothetical protein T439DRAFT_140551 [Meredithblackwellia eburnea MCA 4105]